MRNLSKNIFHLRPQYPLFVYGAPQKIKTKETDTNHQLFLYPPRGRTCRLLVVTLAGSGRVRMLVWRDNYYQLSYNITLMFFTVFAFTDFCAWNATVGVNGKWRKLVYRHIPSTPNDDLEKMEISKSVLIVFVKMETQGFASDPFF